MTFDGDDAVFSGDGRTLAVQQRDNNVQIWDAGQRVIRNDLLVDPSPRRALVLSTNGRLMVTASGELDDSSFLWDTQSAARLKVFARHKQAIQSVALSPDARTVATSSIDRSLKFWNVETGQELLTIPDAGGILEALTFSPDGQILAGRIPGTAPALRLFRAPLLSLASSR